MPPSAKKQRIAIAQRQKMGKVPHGCSLIVFFACSVKEGSVATFLTLSTCLAVLVCLLLICLALVVFFFLLVLLVLRF